MNVFAYIDRSRFADSVLKHAMWAASQLGVGIELIHVLDQPDTSHSHDFSGYHQLENADVALEERIQLDERRNKALVAEGRLLLESVSEHVKAAGVTDVSGRLYQGTMVDHLQHHLGDCVMAVMGKRGEAATNDPSHLGSNVERLVRSAHRPVLVVPAEFRDVQRALLAWDSGASSGEAINFLVKRSLLRGVTTNLLHVSETEDRVPMSLGDARDHLVRSGIEVEATVRPGSVVDSILSATTEIGADLLLIGAYGHSRIRRLIVGSTTTELLLRAGTPVLVFH